MSDPFHKPTFIRLGFNPLTEDYVLHLTKGTTTTRLTLGTATTTAAVMKANRVTHFDYDADLASNGDAMMAFIDASMGQSFQI